MKQRKLSSKDLQNINGGSSEDFSGSGIQITSDNDSLLSLSSEFIYDGRTERRELSLGNGIDLNLSLTNKRQD